MWLLASVSCYVRSDIHCWRADKSQRRPECCHTNRRLDQTQKWVGREQGQNREVQKEQRINIFKLKKSKYLLNTMIQVVHVQKYLLSRGVGHIFVSIWNYIWAWWWIKGTIHFSIGFQLCSCSNMDLGGMCSAKIPTNWSGTLKPLLPWR